jgi:small GTP-binding protein
MSSNSESIKIVLIGESGVGKTSIISQFVNQVFQEDVETSSSGTYNSKTLIYDNNKVLKLEIWDTAGQEKYRSLASMFYKEASAAILVYDITRKDSFEQIQQYWASQIKENSPSNIILALCGNKSDLIEEEKVDEEEARNYAKEINAIFYPTSAKNDSGITDLFLQIAKKYTNSDNVKLKTDKDEVFDSTLGDSIESKNRGSVKITKEEMNNVNEVKKKKCC